MYRALVALWLVKGALGRLGSEAQMLAKFQKNETEKMKNTKMPVAAAVNPALEADFKKVIATMGWKESVVKINLLNQDWSTLYHSITGNIIARTQQAAVSVSKFLFPSKGKEHFLFHFFQRIKVVHV
jgi:hypothetical protein